MEAMQIAIRAGKGRSIQDTPIRTIKDILTIPLTSPQALGEDKIMM